MGLVVGVDEVKENGVTLPDGKVTVGVVDNRRDPSVRIEREERGCLLILGRKVEVDGFIGQLQRLEDVNALGAGKG